MDQWMWLTFLEQLQLGPHTGHWTFAQRRRLQLSASSPEGPAAPWVWRAAARMDSPVMLSKIAGWKLSLSICSSIAVGCAGLQEISDSLSWCIINGYIQAQKTCGRVVGQKLQGSSYPSLHHHLGKTAGSGSIVRCIFFWWLKASKWLLQSSSFFKKVWDITFLPETRVVISTEWEHYLGGALGTPLFVCQYI